VSVPADTAVYFASGRGDFETTVEVMATLFRDGGAPKPLSFVNTVSNAACYYVARSLKLQSRSNFVCNRNLAFESVLQLALMEVESGGASALVGSVDAVTMPLAEHRRRVHLPPDAPLAEGSHWLWIGTVRSDLPRLGEVVAVEQFHDAASLLAWMAAQHLTAEDTTFSAGQFLDEGAAHGLRTQAGLNRVFDYRAGRGYYDSQSGAVIAGFLATAPAGARLLHVNADPAGCFSAMLVAR
jgi:hypothetical protein